MGIGPLGGFSFPGVFTRTQNKRTSTPVGGRVRYPAIIGVAAEEERIDGYELVRGSSSISDNVIVDEDVSNQLDGSTQKIKLKHFPIVDGSGRGVLASQPSNVLVTVNGNPTAVNAINALKGEITLVAIPEPDATVRVSYYFKRRDTFIESEDLSDQAVAGAVSFKVLSSRIVRGDNGGVSATNSDIGVVTSFLYNPSDVIGDEYVRSVKIFDVKVDGVSVDVAEIDGSNGVFKLATPLVNDNHKLTVTYFTNDWQDTYDILPAPEVKRLIKVGNSPETSDYSIGSDVVLSGGNKIHWGNSVDVSKGVYTIGSDPLADNIVVSNTDTKVWGVVAEPKDPAVDSLGNTVKDADGNTLNNDASGNRSFTLPSLPVDGTGLGKVTENFKDGPDSDTKDDIIAYVGSDWQTAKAAGPVAIESIVGNVLTLVSTIPTEASSEKVFVTYYENKLVDDIWTLTNKNPGSGNSGVYTITSRVHGNAVPVTYVEGTTTPIYAGSGAYNVAADPSRLAVERVIITFDGVGGFTVTSENPLTQEPGKTGSVTANNANKGYLGKTYGDVTTGFTVTFDDAVFSPANGAVLKYDVGNPTATTAQDKYDIKTDTNIIKAIPGVNLTVSSTLGGNVDNTLDTALINTYNGRGAEPTVGDYYYVTFDKSKLDFEPRVCRSIREVIRYFGPLEINNRVVVAANLAFQNGAPAVAIKQIKRAEGGADAPVQAYIDAIDTFNAPLVDGTRPSLIQPLSTDPQVHAYLKTSNTIQASLRYKNERTSIIGFGMGTTPDQVIRAVSDINSERIVAIYPDTAIITLPDAYGNDVEYMVDGSLIAVAVAGLDTNPSMDIATPLTNKTLAGIKRLGRRLDEMEAAQIASAGCTVLSGYSSLIKIKMYLTTSMSDALTRNPRIAEVKDYVQKGLREALGGIAGSKNLPRLIPDIRDKASVFMNSLAGSQIIAGYKGVNVSVNEDDSSTVDVEIIYSPIMPLNWIVVSLNLGLGQA